MNLEDKVLDKLEETLVAVRESTNPKLSNILLGFNKKLDEQAAANQVAKKMMEDHVELHQINDKKWDEALIRMEPMLASWDSATGFRKFSMSLFMFIIALGGAFATVWAFFKFIVLEAIRK